MERTPENLARTLTGRSIRDMEAVENTPTTLRDLSPVQKLWIVRLMAFTGAGLLWRLAHMTWPSTHLAIVSLVAFALTFTSCLHLLNTLPRYRILIPWCTGVVVGGLLNFAVIIANQGYMPVAGRTETQGFHCPMNGANLVHLCDWIWGFASPGDVIMAVAGVGIVATLIVRRWRFK